MPTHNTVVDTAARGAFGQVQTLAKVCRRHDVAGSGLCHAVKNSGGRVWGPEKKTDVPEDHFGEPLFCLDGCSAASEAASDVGWCTRACAEGEINKPI